MSKGANWLRAWDRECIQSFFRGDYVSRVIIRLVITKIFVYKSLLYVFVLLLHESDPRVSGGG